MKNAIIAVMFAVCCTGVFAEEPKAENVTVEKATDAKIAKRETLVSKDETGATVEIPIYEADETIPVGVVAHVREKNGAFRGSEEAAPIILTQAATSACSNGSCSNSRQVSTCSNGSCAKPVSSSTSIDGIQETVTIENGMVCRLTVDDRVNIMGHMMHVDDSAEARADVQNHPRHPITGAPLYKVSEKIPGGVSVCLVEEDGSFVGGGSSLGSCGVGGCKSGSCSGGSCSAPKVASSEASAPVSVEKVIISVPSQYEIKPVGH